VVHVCNLPQEAEIRRIEVQGQPRQRVCETPISSIKKMGMLVLVCYPRYTGGIHKRIKVQASPRQRKKIKNLKAEKG
jgi:hypothetical protein